MKKIFLAILAASLAGVCSASDGSDAAFAASLKDGHKKLLGSVAASKRKAPRRDSRHDPEALVALLQKVAQVKQGGQTPVVLFDIDDTLTYPTGRNLAILKDFLAQPDVQRAYPDEVAKLQKLDRFNEIGYSLTDSVKKFGGSDALIKQLNDYWAPRFFASGYLSHDTEVPGAAAYVQKIAGAGAVVAYFTGRNPAMLDGTLATLKKFGFPLPDNVPTAAGYRDCAKGDRTCLVIKIDKDQPDAEFKEVNLKAFGTLGTVAGGFENEPKHINLFKAFYPDGVMIFLDTHQSHPVDPATGQPIVPLPSVAWVKNFRLPS